MRGRLSSIVDELRPSSMSVSLMQLPHRDSPKTLPVPRQSHERPFGVMGKFYEEARPVRGVRYFLASTGASTACVVCLYNEEGPELSRTISTVAASWIDMIIVADGLEKLSASMREFLCDTFRLSPEIFYHEKSSSVWGAADQTFVSNPTELYGGRVTLLLKRFNHKKINSHEWFFMAHLPNTGCRYALTTDTGAVFRADTVRKLVSHLHTNPSVAAVTGRQRVMSEANQRRLGRATPEYDSLGDWMMRSLQGFDFELDHVAGKAANCALHFVPCLHGPCACFRYSAVRGRVLAEYFDEWGYAPPHTLRLLGANLQIAEDRIPSLLSVMYSGKTSASLFDAVFEFEAELSLKAFITQRRRWGNGSLAGLVYALTQAPKIMRSEHSTAFKLANLALISLQTLSCLLTFVSPALFGFLFVSAVGVLADQLISLPGIYAADAAFNATLHDKRLQPLPPPIPSAPPPPLAPPWAPLLPSLPPPSLPPPEAKTAEALRGETVATIQTLYATAYALFYASFVYVHLKRTKDDRVLHAPLLKVSFHELPRASMTLHDLP